MINASFLPTKFLVENIKNLKENQAIFKNEEVIAFFTTENQDEVNFENYEQIEFDFDVLQVKNTWDIFSLNDQAIRDDFELITEGRTSQPIPDGVQYSNEKNIFIEENVEIHFSVLNATDGPIYIGKNATVMEGSLVRGPFSLGENSVLKMGAKIYGATTIGPFCKVGGEVNNSVLMGYSNKGHDGFLGNSVLGEWCNIGADSNNSNLKNNYSQVRLWSYETENFAKTGLQFCGLVMGDHSKCAINTMFNTGTVVGVSANIYGSNFPRNFIPSFSWGGAAGFSTYQINKAKETANLVLKRRDIEFDEKEARILEHIFEITEKYRNF
tara:strand:- start:8 stop:985 length:978 start_codon:yes stop_codon:yes gene_type:complete